MVQKKKGLRCQYEKKKGPLILTGVLVILLIVYFGLSSWNKKQDKKEEKETVKVTDLDESTITAIKYQVAAGEMSFEKEGDTWYYSEDKDFPLKQSKPEAIVKRLPRSPRTGNWKTETAWTHMDWMTRIIPLRSRKKTEQ